MLTDKQRVAPPAIILGVSWQAWMAYLMDGYHYEYKKEDGKKACKKAKKANPNIKNG